MQQLRTSSRLPSLTAVSVCLQGGVFLGLCIILILAAFPGNPVDFSTKEDVDGAHSGKDSNRRPIVGE